MNRKLNSIRLRGLLRSRMGEWNLALFLGGCTLFAAISLLAISGWFISAAALAGLTTTAAYGFDYFRPAALIRLCAIVRTGGRYAERLASHHAALGLLKDLRISLFARVAGRGHSSVTRSSSAMHRLVADIDLLDFFPLRVVAPWFWASLLTAVLLGGCYLLAPLLALTALPGVLLAWLLLPLLAGRHAARLARADVGLAEQRRILLLDNLQMLTPLLLWQRWSARQAVFAGEDQRFSAQRLRQQQWGSLIAAGQQLGLSLSLLGMLWQGGLLVQAGELSLPLLLAAVLGLLGLTEVLLPLAQSFIALGLSQAARDRLNQLTSEPARQTEQGAAALTELRRLSLSGLSARHEGALSGPHQVDLQLKAGDVLLLSGPSGCGKSTLLEVLAGEPLAYSGERLLNGKAYEHWQWRSVIGYLPQQLDIFDMTLAENLRLGRPVATDDELWEVLEDVALADWARARPAQLNTTLGEYGAQVSGGQARRIALARLLLAQRPLLLLDEPFAGLDAATREQVLAALLRRQASGMLVIVSHQPLELEQAQRLQLTMN
ncbi:amino acid ABC transporter ATP-binding/permease protein [Pseudomonas sp. 5Ae-yellow]|uniref:amino acid ABC transporter ATP-binding/permease protein n=1 Tax=Pseudomonas sp. 5Ae-yellow TaxID=2759848 RepID=UPI0015F4F968|nr:ATP-binding cassette domain-containing protein [Pseudomonas sp. 5Ae-yellow]MBA6420692.1 ATP-binding cassette domain-containing protein [Pseudomonas sp. 5Ae-yellow]